MAKIFAELKKGALLFCVLVLGSSDCQAVQGLDENRYITIDQVRPGMEAYCLTVYEGTEVEKFGLKVLSVVRGVMPGRNWILVQGTDQRFIHTGPVGGCSGSPVYIDGRLAGALAYAPGWPFSKDPLYGVTPIEEMLRVSEQTRPGFATDPRRGSETGFAFDFSKPLDFAEIDKQITSPLLLRNSSTTGVAPLPCPLVTSGLPAQVVEQLNTLVEPLGLIALAGIDGGTCPEKNGDARLVPGACLAVPLAAGDISIDVVGTVTEVIGDKVFGFGHGFLGYGPVDLPMATGKVHTVVSSTFRSFKFASAVEIIGALTMDESTAVYGRIGAQARMIPIAITVDRYNDPERRTYNCQLANNRLYTPLVLRFALAGAVLMLGSLPPDHMIEYKVTIGLEDAESIAFENVSTSLGLNEMIVETTVPVAILMNNPYKSVNIESIDVAVSVLPKSILSHIWSVDLSDSRVKPGEEIEIGVVVESFLAEKKRYQGGLKVPEQLAPGKYGLLVCGWQGYQQFLMKAAPHRFIPQNLTSLIEALNTILRVKRDELYCLLVLPPGGVTVENAELPDLPATKVLILENAKRTLRTQPYQHWIEKSFPVGTVIIDQKEMHITVLR